MRHQRAGKKLGRDASHRKALYANLAGALIEHGRIKTTVAKAKAVRPVAEQMITLGRRGRLRGSRGVVVGTVPKGDCPLRSGSRCASCWVRPLRGQTRHVARRGSMM